MWLKAVKILNSPEEEIKAITSTAKDYGMQVAAHAHGDEGMYRAVANGVKTIEHGTLIEEKNHGVDDPEKRLFALTISAGKYVAEKQRSRFYPPLLCLKPLPLGTNSLTLLRPTKWVLHCSWNRFWCILTR